MVKNFDSMKKNILIIMGRYLPGFKDGGPVRSIKNLVDYLGTEYNFMILTCDRDHGDMEPYSNIKVNEWNKIGNANVFYVPPKGFNLRLIKGMSEQVDLLYICGCFNDYAINTLILNRLGLINKPVVVAAMGLFSPMEFKLKYRKKKLFVNIFNFLGMFKKIYWSATSEMEVKEISQQIRTHGNFFIAQDLPRKVTNTSIEKYKKLGELKVVFISRIAPKKNLKGAIQILQNVKGMVEFTIYGPKHVVSYWKECEEELEKLPPNIKWYYGGNVESEQVIDVLREQHVFLFPTLGENYGHVIHEALSAGCPCIISDQTPWQDLGQRGVGYVYSLERLNDFAAAVDFYCNMDEEKFNEYSNRSLSYAIESSNNKASETGYIKILEGIL